jgi:predicted nucleotide-binding protein
VPDETKQEAVIKVLRHLADSFVKFPNHPKLALQLFTHAIRNQLVTVYGEDDAQLDHFTKLPDGLPDAQLRAELAKRAEHVHRIVATLDRLVDATATVPRSVFIGHGRSLLWRELKDIISDRLSLPWDEFNREAVAGYTTGERLQAMLSQAAFAFLVLTAEEEHTDRTLHARSNVIHEVGLFQGRLGSHRAILLLEDGCAEFSNIAGLSQIRFPRGDIAARFEEVRRVLERERLL